ncbi:hypothetical protein CHU98_g312 [Xylaria longipes]|nr:hypothetical protein CHU98_g312 [Xylaria longipes]
MVFQLSLGDGIRLAQIAWLLAQTFTKGRRSAPAEFQEIENELYGLSAALTAAENEQNNAQSSTNPAVPDNNRHAATQDIFEHIIQNCKQILNHLEEIVNKYTIVSEKRDPDKPKLKEWSKSIVRNWRKIEWTTEKGDLNTLRSQIMRSLDKKLALLEELHQWYIVNLKETVPKRSTASDGLIHAETTQIQSSSLISTFELAKKRETGDEIICPCVSLRSEWIESFIDGTLGASSGCMFACSCLDCHVGVLSHQVAVQRYGYIRHLEDTFFHTLSSRRGRGILAQGAGNSLCYISPEDQEQRILEARVCFGSMFREHCLKDDLNISQKSVESIIFKSGRTQHVREWVDDVQILQYGVRNSGVSVGDTQTDLIRWLEYAEVLISFNVDEAHESGDVASMVLKLRRNTLTKLMEKGSVDIMSIEAVGTHSDERTTAHNELDVTIQFTTKSAAKEFHEKLEAMRTELFVRSLQYPRSNERVVLNLQTARVECESLYIDDAEIIIVVDTDAKYRLIIASRNRCTIISQALVEDFFTSPSNRPNYIGSTYIVQIGDTGERKVYYYKNGFRHLSLSTTQG